MCREPAQEPEAQDGLPFHVGYGGRLLPRATRSRTVPVGAALDDSTLYFNRELSEIDFNWRVLQQAADLRTPCSSASISWPSLPATSTNCSRNAWEDSNANARPA